MHIGRESMEAGRFMRSGKPIPGRTKELTKEDLEPPSNDMAECIHSLGFPVERLRTGTPPRIAYDSINFTEMDAQVSDDPI